MSLAETLAIELGEIGFSFHTNEKGEWWWAWAGPKNEWDVETGSTWHNVHDAAIEAVKVLIGYVREQADLE